MKMSEECPFKIKQTDFYNIDVNNTKKIDYCKAFNLECVGEKLCPIVRK